MSLFAELGLDERLVKAVAEMGFTEPTPIQQEVIPMLINEDNDLMGLAQTGTGKTAAFGLPLLHRIDTDDRSTQGLILSPTRELCLQIANDLVKFTKHKPVQSVAVYGGSSIDTQIREIKRGAHIIVATPGRLLDLIKRGVIKLQTIKVVVLDEADEMLNMGFQEDIDDILSHAPDTKKTWLFSATMPREVRAIAERYMHQPKEISTGKKNTTNENIEHTYYVVQPRDRYDALKRIVDYYPDIFGMIFCRTKIESQEVAEKLMKEGYNADALHGDLSQAQREKVMRHFRDRSIQIMVATDVAARGIDVNDITHVIHYNLPDDTESYTHRSGRTARAGKKGTSIALVSSRDVGRIRQIEKLVNRSFEQKSIPTGKEVCEKQLWNVINKILNADVKEEQIAPFLVEINKAFESMTKEELIKKIATQEFSRFLDYYDGARDLNTSNRRDSEGRGDRDRDSRSSRDGRDGRERRDRDGREGGRERDGGRPDRGFKMDNRDYTRIFINIGEVDGFNRKGLSDFLSSTANVRKASIGDIFMKQTFAFFEFEANECSKLFTSLNGRDFEGRKIRLDYAEGEEGKANGGGGSSRPPRDRESGGGFRSERGDRSSSGGGRYGGSSSSSSSSSRSNERFDRDRSSSRDRRKRF